MSERRMWTWYSNNVKKEMTVASWGHYGKPVLLFPTAAADCLDNERFKLIWKLQPFIDQGRIKVYSCESVNAEAWLNKDAHPAHKADMQARYDRYLIEELLPHISNDCNGEKGFVATGASLGAYNALTVSTKHPEWFDLCIAMSGTYDFDRWMNGHTDQNYYFNQPMYFLGNMSESKKLDKIRQNTYVLASGSGRHEAPDESERVAKLLQSKGVQNTFLEIWGKDAHHDWPTWRSMLPLFINKMV